MNPICESSSMAFPTSSNQYIQPLPVVPPSTTIARDAFSTNKSEDVSIRQIFNTKQKLCDRLSMMAIQATKNNLRFSSLIQGVFRRNVLLKSVSGGFGLLRTRTILSSGSLALNLHILVKTNSCRMSIFKEIIN